MTQPTVWRFVGVVSSVVGFLCFGLSSSFPYMFGKWIWWKISVYGIFGIIICLVLLLAKERQRQTSPWHKAHFAFSVFSIICVYTFFWDKVVKVRPDAHIVISSTAFAIMSFVLSRLSHSGVEIDLVNFFCGNLIAQLMKIKLLLAILGLGFSYFLFILRSRLDGLADPVLPLQETQPNPVLPVQNDHDDLAVDTQLEVEDDDDDDDNDDNDGNTQLGDDNLSADTQHKYNYLELYAKSKMMTMPFFNGPTSKNIQDILARVIHSV
ncbi:uncharacterized protein LOC133308500 [Gastrolobium bilobum]|uniref:uncharacterized protein LOC133308500 n=1 Tax=Gastrolobium bilobum TaxID=150636 RepID=UPI002AB27832|nr:uncharacterized protein LOC133308500 [Gastrolobium bilobum]